MSKRKKGSILGISPHPDDPTKTDIPGHLNHRNGVVVKGKEMIKNLKFRFEEIIKEEGLKNEAEASELGSGIEKKG